MIAIKSQGEFPPRCLSLQTLEDEKTEKLSLIEFSGSRFEDYFPAWSVSLLFRWPVSGKKRHLVAERTNLWPHVCWGFFGTVRVYVPWCDESGISFMKQNSSSRNCLHFYKMAKIWTKNAQW